MGKTALLSAELLSGCTFQERPQQTVGCTLLSFGLCATVNMTVLEVSSRLLKLLLVTRAAFPFLNYLLLRKTRWQYCS